MLQFFRKVLGLGPSKLFNEIDTKKATLIKPYTESNANLDSNNVLPFLISEKTREINLNNELVSVFHDRENIYGKVVVAHVLLKKKDDDFDIFHISTADKDNDFVDILLENDIKNLDKHDIPFEFWNPLDDTLPFKMLSTKISAFSSEKIMSKKHMSEAHKMLDSDKLFVSIPRKGLIFICKKDLKQEDLDYFFKLHQFIVMDNNNKHEFLCEDLFVVENGEISGVLELKELSKSLIELNM